MATPTPLPDSHHKKKLPPSQQEEEEGDNKQGLHHSLQALSTATAASMGEPAAGVAKGNGPSLQKKTDHESVPSLQKKMGYESVDDSEEKKPIAKRKRPRPNVKPDVKVYVEPMLDRDVLLGRGARIPANRMYRVAKESMHDRYVRATSKNEKISISQELVNIVTSRGGRFLKLDDEVHPTKWYPVSNLVARKKASQAMRDACEERASKRFKYTKT
jgi:hypothetical protein